MTSNFAAVACMIAVSGLFGAAQPQPKQPPKPSEQQARPDDEHPPAGHPVIPRPSADWPKAKAEDVGTVDAIIAAYYESTGGDRGQARQWERFRSLFYPEGRLMAARPGADGSAAAAVLTVTDYVNANQKYFEKRGFYDKEVARRTESFGNIVQVWSTYESRQTKDGAEPYSRGIASLQLLKDGSRYWILNVVWDFEREGNPIPEKYRTTPKD